MFGMESFLGQYSSVLAPRQGKVKANSLVMLLTSKYTQTWQRGRERTVEFW